MTANIQNDTLRQLKNCWQWGSGFFFSRSRIGMRNTLACDEADNIIDGWLEKGWIEDTAENDDHFQLSERGKAQLKTLENPVF